MTKMRSVSPFRQKVYPHRESSRRTRGVAQALQLKRLLSSLCLVLYMMLRRNLSARNRARSRCIGSGTLLHRLPSLNPATGVMEDHFALGAASLRGLTSTLVPLPTIPCHLIASMHPPGPIHQPGVQLETGVRVKMWG